MAEILTDDELDLTDEERKRKPRPIGGAIEPADATPLTGRDRDLATGATQPEAIGSPISVSENNAALIRRAGGMNGGETLSGEGQPQEGIGGPIAPSRYDSGSPRLPASTTVTPGLDRARAEIAAQPPPALPASIGGPIQTEQPLAPRPNYERYEQLLGEKQKPWGELGIGGKIGRVAEGIGSAIVPGPVAMIPGTRLHHEFEINRARNAAEEENREIASRETESEKQAGIGEKNALAEQARARAESLRRGKQERTGSPEADTYYSLIDAGKSPQEALELVKGAGKQDRPVNSTAFEAFAYGTPEEKQAAEQFLEYERRIGAKYRTPNEFDLRYKLFREDPDTYRAMFGDKGAAADERTRIADRNHATAMLKFFEKQRDEISKNFMLGDDEKKQKLAEIEELERPFREAARGGNANDRVDVVAPDGTPGTIPRSQLKKAQSQGYKVAGRP